MYIFTPHFKEVMTILPNFPLTANAAISKHFIQNGILDFQGAIHFVQHLPYGRNTDKRDSVSYTHLTLPTKRIV